MSDWLKREKTLAECGFCWTDDINWECPEHGREAMRDAALAHFKALSENLKADNARLRALVKDSEWHAGDREGWCQFCGSMDDGADGMALKEDLHSPRCPAFTPEGVVK